MAVVLHSRLHSILRLFENSIVPSVFNIAPHPEDVKDDIGADKTVANASK